MRYACCNLYIFSSSIEFYQVKQTVKIKKRMLSEYKDTHTLSVKKSFLVPEWILNKFGILIYFPLWNREKVVFLSKSSGLIDGPFKECLRIVIIIA